MRQSLRECINIEDVLKHEDGWYVNILYDADLATKQEYLEIDDQLKTYLYFIQPVLNEVQK